MSILGRRLSPLQAFGTLRPIETLSDRADPDGTKIDLEEASESAGHTLAAKAAIVRGVEGESVHQALLSLLREAQVETDGGVEIDHDQEIGVGGAGVLIHKIASAGGTESVERLRSGSGFQNGCL